MKSDNSFIQSFSKLGSVAVLRPLFSAIKMKYFAIYFGVAGIGILGQSQMMISLLYSFSSLGLGMAITKYLSEQQISIEDQIGIIRKIFKVLIVAIILQTMIVLLLKEMIGYYLFSSMEYGIIITVLGYSIPFLVVSRILESILHSQRMFSLSTRAQLLSITLSFILFFPLSNLYGILGAVLAIASHYVLMVIFSFLALKKHYPAVMTVRSSGSKYSSKYVKQIYVFALSNLARSILIYFSIVILRSTIVHKYGVVEIGYYQAAYSISMYIVTGFQALAVYLLPVVSKYGKSEILISAEVNNVFKSTVLLLLPITFSTILFRSEIIHLLYSSEFSKSLHPLVILALGQMFNILNILNTSALLGLNKLKMFMVIDVGRYVGHLLIFKLGFFQYGILGVAISLLISQFLFFLYSQYTLSLNGIKLDWKNVVLLLQVLISLGLLSAWSIFPLPGNIYIISVLIFMLTITIIHPRQYVKIYKSLVS